MLKTTVMVKELHPKIYKISNSLLMTSDTKFMICMMQSTKKDGIAVWKHQTQANTLCRREVAAL